MEESGVLIVDDDDDLLVALSEFIVHLMGRPTVTASSLAMLKERRTEALGCAVAILDVNLGPGEPTGVDAYGWLRQESFPGRVVFFTGHASSHPEVDELHRHHRIEILAKPASTDALRRAIQGTT